jgi:hypothetical protein
MTNIKLYLAGVALAAAFAAGFAVNGWRLGAKLATAQAATAVEHSARVTAEQNSAAADAVLAQQTAAINDLRGQAATAQGAADSIAAQAAKDRQALQARINALLATPLPADPTEAVREACRRRAALLAEVPR